MNSDDFDKYGYVYEHNEEDDIVDCSGYDDEEEEI